MKKRNKPFTKTIIVFAVALVLSICACVTAVLAREGVFALPSLSNTDLLFIIIISAILVLIFLICVTALTATRISLSALRRAELKKEMARLAARAAAVDGEKSKEKKE